MKYLPLAIGLLALGLGYVLFYPQYFSLCEITANGYYRDCLWNRDVSRNVGNPVFIYALASLPALAVLIFAKQQVVSSWLRFAIWWLPLSAVFVAVTPSVSHSWMPLLFIGKETVSWIMGCLFLLISVLIILWKSPASDKFLVTCLKVFLAILTLAASWVLAGFFSK